MSVTLFRFNDNHIVVLENVKNIMRQHRDTNKLVFTMIDNSELTVNMESETQLYAVMDELMSLYGNELPANEKVKEVK